MKINWCSLFLLSEDVSDILSENLAKFDSPLIKGVDIIDKALDSYSVLIKP